MRSLARWTDVIRGVAIGDAWGAPNELYTYVEIPEIAKRDSTYLPKNLEVTDDTQMTLFLARALNGCRGEAEIKQAIVREFLNYLHDVDFASRGPGKTVSASLRRIDAGIDWQSASPRDATGCGAVMRVSPAAFLPEDTWVGAAAVSAAVTHASPMCVAAAIVDVAVIRACLTGETGPGRVINHALSLAREPDAFGLLDPCGWVAELCLDLKSGFAEVEHALLNAQKGLHHLAKNPRSGDPCEYGGAGWMAHECLATALLCVDLFPGDPWNGLWRATITGGDSDSIAAVTGAVLGASFDDPWPGKAVARLERRYRNWIIESESYIFSD